MQSRFREDAAGQRFRHASGAGKGQRQTFEGSHGHIGEGLSFNRISRPADIFAARPFEWQDKPLPLSFAFGVHAFQKGENADAAMANADKAMYAAKRKPAKE